MTTFGDIRSLAHQSPSHTLWVQLCKALDDHDELSLSSGEVIEYCRKLLTRWPVHIARQAPARWAVRFLEHEHVPELCLATELDLYHDEQGEMLDILRYSSPNLVQISRNAPRDWFTSLRSLDCRGYYLKGELLLELCSLPWVQDLEELELGENYVDDEVLQVLTTFASLWRLDVSYGQGEVGTQGLKALFRTGLEELNLSYCNLRHKELAWFDVFSSCESTSLRVLDLCGAGILMDGSTQCVATMLADQPALKNLERLDIRFNYTSLPGLVTIIDSPHLESLRWLGATCGKIGDEGARTLASRPGLARLHHLDLAFCGIGGQGLKALSHSLYVKNLRSLEIGRVVRRDKNSEKTSKLDCYQDYAEPFDIESVSALARSQGFEQLAHLGLQESDLQAEHIEALGHNVGLQKLRSLDLRGNGNGDDTRRRLR